MMPALARRRGPIGSYGARTSLALRIVRASPESAGTIPARALQHTRA
jgi:hypothetical protein